MGYYLSCGRYSAKPAIVINISQAYEGFRRGEDCGNIDPVTIGMQVTTADGRIMTIASVTETSRTYATYNLTVADFQTYFVGQNKVLVHNCGLFESFSKNLDLIDSEYNRGIPDGLAQAIMQERKYGIKTGGKSHIKKGRDALRFVKNIRDA